MSDSVEACRAPCGSIDCAYGCMQGKPWTGSVADSKVVPMTTDDSRVVPMMEPPMAQPTPKPNQHPAVWPLVMVDMASRDKLGRELYGVPLQPHNGRDMLRDIYDELLDAAVYIRAAMYERDGK